MSVKTVSFLGLFLFVSYVHGGKVSFITPCKATDSKCHKDNVAVGIPIYSRGIPELNVVKLDPMTLKKVDASRPGLKFIITDAIVDGMRNCVAKKASRDPEKGKLILKFLCDGTLEAQYELKGQLLVIPIEGKGGLHAVLRKLVINVELDLGEKIGADGKKHWEITKWTHSFELKDKADLVFDNLFPGNEILGNAARSLIETNGNDVILEIGPPLVKRIIAEIVKSVQKFFDTVPLEDLTLD